MKLGSVFITGVLAAGATASWLSSAGKPSALAPFVTIPSSSYG